GDMIIKNIRKTSAPDLVIFPNVELTLSRSLTPTSHIADSLGYFSDATILKFDTSSTLLMYKNARINLRDSSSIELLPNAKIVLKELKQIKADIACSIVLHKNATILLSYSGTVITRKNNTI